MQLTNEQLISFELIKIDSIENVGMKNCVDIQVEDDESFTLGNGIISHNSALGGISKILGNKDFSYFTLRGKPLNVWEVSHQKFAANKELSELYQIIRAEETGKELNLLLDGDFYEIEFEGKKYIVNENDTIKLNNTEYNVKDLI